jgi:hypothetical protein
MKRSHNNNMRDERAAAHAGGGGSVGETKYLRFSTRLMPY